MTGLELKKARKELGLTSAKLGFALGYRGDEETAGAAVRRMESGKRRVRPAIARLVYMFVAHGVPEEWLLPSE